MKPKPGNEAGISWLGRRGQLRPDGFSANIGFSSQLARAAFGCILVLQSKAYLQPAEWLAHTVSLYKL